MSIARQFLREFAPVFRALEQPLGRQTAAFGVIPRHSPFSVFEDPFFSGGRSMPNVDLSEEANHYVVEAELPGVKKENVDIRIGDGGQSLTIEGKRFSSLEHKGQAQAQEGGEAQAQTPRPADDSTKAVSTPLSTERSFSSSSFSRTIWLPRRVEGSGVSAKLSDGILTVRIPKAEDKGSIKVDVE